LPENETEVFFLYVFPLYMEEFEMMVQTGYYLDGKFYDNRDRRYSTYPEKSTLANEGAVVYWLPQPEWPDIKSL